MKKSKVLYRYNLMAFFMLFMLQYCMAQSTITPFAKGADVGWLSQMEATGYQFYDLDGTQKECLQLLKDREMNTIRLRVWVNPSADKTNGHCSAAETVAMAVRAKNLGMRIMIDFHYSDSWADPGKQIKPAAWASHSFSALLDDVYNHTFDVLSALKTADVTPEWVQIGNEIPNGMLWPEGSTSNWAQLAQLLNKGYDATKAVDSSIKVIVHIDKGNDNARSRNFYEQATSNNVKFDVIGLSYYPYWLGSDYTASIGALQNNLIDMASRYNKEVMIVEVGGDYSLVQNTYDMLKAVVSAVKNVPDNKGLGVIYWEPQGEKSWSGYQLNAWQSNGKPSLALDAFKGDSTVVLENIAIDGFAANPVEQGKTFSLNLTYTAFLASEYFYVGLFKRNSNGSWLQTIVESSGNQFLVPSTGTNNTGQVTLNIPLATPPSASLTNGEYYDVQVELWTEGWGTKLDSKVSPRLTIAAAGSLSVEKKKVDNQVILYPNPVTTVLNLKNSGGNLITAAKISNVLGKTLYYEPDFKNRDKIDVSNLSSGIYLLSLVSVDGTQTIKFQKK